MKQTLVAVSKQWWSVVPFLGVNRQDIEMHAKKSDENRGDEFFSIATKRKQQIIVRGQNARRKSRREAT